MLVDTLCTAGLLTVRVEYSYSLADAFYLFSTGMLRTSHNSHDTRRILTFPSQDRVSKALTPAVAKLLEFRKVRPVHGDFFTLPC